ncbi:transposable element protein, putative [Medicago truncatula]|uniref:Transposable element protein, putative n=1 Tax=Medicago truncatula TaxID=3880 RepID=A0A072TU78_MEDTR|nr:transposable element protein, putative [Medicago truncatula]
MAERTLKEYATPSTEEPQAIIVYPTVEGNNFEIKPALLNLVQQNQFSGSPTEDPNLHISTFKRLNGTIKENQEAVRLHLFPFSLRDRATAWFYSLEVDSVDAAAGGALMNKNYTEAYALIEDMAQNHYQWTNERAITASTPSRKEAGMYEVSYYDHLAAKVDALTQKFEKHNVSAVTPTPTSPPCKICGIFGHIGVDCQLGSAANSIEQMNYAQYNQGTRPNQNFYKNPQGSYGQVAPPGYTNNQRVAQKSSLEILLENCMMNQNKQLKELKNQTGFLNDSLSKLNTKVDFIATHTKMLETQISQVAQQVATSSQTPGVFLGQTEPNPKAHVNAISFGGSKLQETVAKAKITKGENVKLLGEKYVIKSEKPLDKNKAPSPLRLVKLNLEAQFNKFVNMLKKICIKIPFAESLSRMPLYAKFLK